MQCDDDVVIDDDDNDITADDVFVNNHECDDRHNGRVSGDAVPAAADESATSQSVLQPATAESKRHLHGYRCCRLHAPGCVGQHVRIG